LPQWVEGPTSVQRRSRLNGMDAHRHLPDVLVQPGEASGFPGIVEGERRSADDIREEVAGQQPAVLQHTADLAPDRAHVERSEIWKGSSPLDA
jgi:hypothetical protein